jgi:4-hydroxy-tetrahydrodipicolinate synthase
MLQNQQPDVEGLRQLVEFQVEQGVAGILAVGTTGESPTLRWDEHIQVIEKVQEFSSGRSLTIAGTGSNSTEECMNGTKHAVDHGIRNILLVDPYYNGPSSLEIRKEYIEPIAESFPETRVIPYVIPGRTGTQLLPQDLATLCSQYSNVDTVKEATGDVENMRSTRESCGDDFTILSGDDDKTASIILDEQIRAAGVISVVSNIAHRAVQDMVSGLLRGRTEEGLRIREALRPLFGMVTVLTSEETQYGAVTCKSRNPVPCKTLMAVLGMPSGPCRQPLGRMTKQGLEVVLHAARAVYEDNPEILTPIEGAFDVSLDERLYGENDWTRLTYG